MTEREVKSPLLRILFICRGSVRDGLGHVMRSRTVAQELSRRTNVQFCVIGDGHAQNLLRGRGLNYELVDNPTEAMEIYDEFNPHVVIFDLLKFPEEQFLSIRNSSMTVSLSPIFNCMESVDMLFSRTRYQEQLSAVDGIVPAMRCGLEYTVLRETCFPIPTEDFIRNAHQNPFSIAISMGGADAENNTLRILDAVKSLPGKMLFWVLLGEGYTHSYQDLAEVLRRQSSHEFILAKTSESMWHILRTCSLAILAGGTVTYEAVYAGLPAINVFETGDNVFLVQELIEQEVCLSAGFPLTDALSVINANIIYLERNREELVRMHKNCRALMDGKGTKRICSEIESHYHTNFQKSPTDCRLVGR